MIRNPPPAHDQGMTETPTTAARTPAPARRRTPRGRLVATGLLALTAVPVAAGFYRLVTLATGATVTPENARYVQSPVPVVVHIVAITGYGIFAVFQFLPRFRRRHRRWHRVAGRILVPLGLAVALSGLWMTLFYPRTPYDSAVLTGTRVLVVTGMVAALVLGFRAIRRRDVAAHRAWMIRAYAIAMGAGTQAFTNAPYVAATGEQPGPGWRAFLMILGWAINVVVAEYVIRRSTARPRQRRMPVPRTAPALAD
jgi:uncharacterized membrane protein